MNDSVTNWTPEKGDKILVRNKEQDKWVEREFIAISAHGSRKGKFLCRSEVFNILYSSRKFAKPLEPKWTPTPGEFIKVSDNDDTSRGYLVCKYVGHGRPDFPYKVEWIIFIENLCYKNAWPLNPEEEKVITSVSTPHDDFLSSFACALNMPELQFPKNEWKPNQGKIRKIKRNGTDHYVYYVYDSGDLYKNRYAMSYDNPAQRKYQDKQKTTLFFFDKIEKDDRDQKKEASREPKVGDLVKAKDIEYIKNHPSYNSQPWFCDSMLPYLNKTHTIDSVDYFGKRINLGKMWCWHKDWLSPISSTESAEIKRTPKLFEAVKVRDYPCMPEYHTFICDKGEGHEFRYGVSDRELKDPTKQYVKTNILFFKNMAKADR